MGLFQTVFDASATVANKLEDVLDNIAETDPADGYSKITGINIAAQVPVSVCKATALAAKKTRRPLNTSKLNI